MFFFIILAPDRKDQQLLELIVVFFTYFGAVSLKRMRRFDLLTTDLSHALVVCDLTQIPAEGSGCRWGVVGSSHRQPMRDQDL